MITKKVSAIFCFIPILYIACKRGLVKRFFKNVFLKNDTFKNSFSFLHLMSFGCLVFLLQFDPILLQVTAGVVCWPLVEQSSMTHCNEQWLHWSHAPKSEIEKIY